MSPRPLSKLATLALGALGVIAIGAVDHATGDEIRVFPLYFLPVAFVAWRVSRRWAVAAAAASTAAWAASNWAAGRRDAGDLTWPLNTLSQLVAFATVGLLVAELRSRLLAEQSLSRLDPLTQLPNRRAFEEHSALVLAMARRDGRPLTLAYLDLDHFKRLNDQFGHQAGDRALEMTARLLESDVRATDIVARLGGDEFAILLTDTTPVAARATLERLRETVSAAVQARQWPVTVSVGAVCFTEAPATVDAALHAADELMYRAKQAGRDRVHLEVRDAAAPAPAP